MTTRTPSHHCSRTNGFTLIELLVVMAIIGLVLTLIFSSIGGSVEAANRTACASNLKKCGEALFAYALENDKNELPGAQGGDYPSWYGSEFIKKMAPYADDFKYWGCPQPGLVPLSDPGNTGNEVRGNYQYFPGMFVPKKVILLKDATVLMQDVIYLYNGKDWRSNHNRDGELGTDLVANSPSFRTYLGGDPKGFNSLHGDGSVRWTAWIPGQEGETWDWFTTAGSGGRIPSTVGALDAQN